MARPVVKYTRVVLRTGRASGTAASARWSSFAAPWVRRGPVLRPPLTLPKSMPSCAPLTPGSSTSLPPGPMAKDWPMKPAIRAQLAAGGATADDHARLPSDGVSATGQIARNDVSRLARALRTTAPRGGRRAIFPGRRSVAAGQASVAFRLLPEVLRRTPITPRRDKILGYETIRRSLAERVRGRQGSGRTGVGRPVRLAAGRSCGPLRGGRAIQRRALAEGGG